MSRVPTDEPDRRELLTRAVSGDGFVRAVLSGRRRGHAPEWKRVTARPVVVKGERRTQVVMFDGTKTFTENLDLGPALESLRALLESGFSDLHVETEHETIDVRIARRGAATVHRTPTARPAAALDHDRPKCRLLPASASDPYLRAVGITTARGDVRADRQRKFRQVNEFLRILHETLEGEEAGPLRVVDLGCGRAHLTFAAYHFLNNVVGVPASVVGVDSSEDSIRRNRALAERLGWDRIEFRNQLIGDLDPADPPDVVLALHACDTASDDALAQAVRWRARFVLSSPCCHHHLQEQLRAGRAAPELSLLFRHGILRERLGDVLTDTFRAALLQLLGYRAEVLEFVTPEHTDRNLMLRAVRTGAAPAASSAADYVALKETWGVTPYLEELVAGDLRPLLEP
ncbi:MAG: SAM-dependent methyltransferase [Actinomycetota bacterium]